MYTFGLVGVKQLTAIPWADIGHQTCLSMVRRTALCRAGRVQASRSDAHRTRTGHRHARVYALSRRLGGRPWTVGNGNTKVSERTNVVGLDAVHATDGGFFRVS